MAKKKKSWFNLLRGIFIADTKSRKKDERKGWAFGRFKSKRLASLSAPPPPKKSILGAPEEEKQNYAETRTINTPAAEISRTNTQDFRTGVSPQLSIQDKKESQEVSVTNVFSPASQSHQCQLQIQHLAAIKIQSAFRGYLARKALRALKGLVRLQAIIRGWAVRRQAINTLKCLQSIVNIQSEFRAKRCDMVKTTQHNQENQVQDMTEKDIRIDTNSQRRWDDSTLTRDEANAVSMNKRVASIRRERIKEYWLNHRIQRSTESEQSKQNVKQRYWLEQWVDSQLAKREDLHNIGTAFSANAKAKEELAGRRLRLRIQKQYQIEGFDSPLNVPRRSFHRRQRSNGEEGSFVGSPSVPTYMAATESAKAKVRSMSSPRLRPICFDAYSEINSPYKHKLSPISSINSEATSCSQISKHYAFSQRSPCLKVIPGPVKSHRSLKEFNLIVESNKDQLNVYG